ncbi:MAG: hypothetical protein U5N53_24575 [Mycobacterium sp.]|nr:hypothetical protein [Mycobacterium sp.]
MGFAAAAVLVMVMVAISADQRQANPQKAWEGNDLNDVTSLATAVPHGDVVVTERSWASLINAAKVGDRVDTVVTARIQDVVDRPPVTS